MEYALKTLVERNRVVAEGAGAVSVAAAMFGPVPKAWKKVVAVVCGGCLDSAVLMRILGRESFGFERNFAGAVAAASAGGPSAGAGGGEAGVGGGAGANGTTNGAASGGSSTQQHGGRPAPVPCPVVPRLLKKQPKILSALDVKKHLPMSACITAVEQALVAFATGSGGMPLRQVIKLPFPNDQQKLGFLGCMPSFCEDYAACKCISVFPANSKTNGAFSSHQGAVLLWETKNHGELVLLADAHEVTKIRTSAASAAATKAILGSSKLENAETLAIVGTGDQAHSHAEAMAEILPNLKNIRLYGRSAEKAATLQKDILSTGFKKESAPKVTIHTSVEDCVKDADVVCTVTAATEPILFDKFLKEGCHVNAVGACQPQFRELGPCVFQNVFQRVVYTDSVEACQQEPGDVLEYLKSCVGDAPQFVGIGDVLAGRQEVAGTGSGRYTLFKSLGIALEDLFAAKVLHERTG